MTPRSNLNQRIGVATEHKVREDAAMKALERQPQKDVVPGSVPEPRLPAYVGILTAAAICFGCMYYQISKNQEKKLWMPQELALFNGTDPKLPLLLSFVGEVYDVTKGQKHYGVGEAYHHFVARDATRAFITGNYSRDMTDDVAGLDHHQLNSLMTWREFYRNNYHRMGKLIGRFYDMNGEPTASLHQLDNLIKHAQAALQHEAAVERQHPSCNSRWSQDVGGEVWCEEGFPRKVFKLASGVSEGSSTRMRCACFQENELGRPDLKEYSQCAPTSSKCFIFTEDEDD